MSPRLFVHDAVLRQLKGLPASRDEVGGWMLGYWTADDQSLVVTHVTPPASRGTPHGVSVSADGHKERFEAAWKASGGHVTFLGDWHTHPGGPPLPSSRDRRAVGQLADDPNYATPRPLMAIVTVPRWVGIGGTRHVAFFLREPDGDLVVLEPKVFRERVLHARDVGAGGF